MLTEINRDRLIRLRPLLILAAAAAVIYVELVVIHPNWGNRPILEPSRAENLSHVIEAGKAYNDLVNALTTFGTGLFLLVALVARRRLLPTIRTAAADFIIIALFGVSITGAFYLAVQARFAIAHGILDHELQVVEIEQIVDLQAWFTLFSGLCAATLIGEALLTHGGVLTFGGKADSHHGDRGG